MSRKLLYLISVIRSARGKEDSLITKWYTTWDNVPSARHAQGRFKSACAYAQSYQSLRSLHKIYAYLAISNAPCEDSDQTARMRRLIWIFIGRTCPKECFLTLRFILSKTRLTCASAVWSDFGVHLHSTRICDAMKDLNNIVQVCRLVITVAV